jgi:hypothetical protein
MTAPLVSLKSGQTKTVPFACFSSNGAVFNLTGYTATLVVTGRNGVKNNFVCTNDSPATLGTCSYTFLKADYDILKVGMYDAELWVSNGDGANDDNYPVLTMTIEVLSTPQRI